MERLSDHRFLASGPASGFAAPTTADRQLAKRQGFDQFVESVPYQKLSGAVSPPFHSPKSH